MLVLFGVNGVVLKYVLCALGGLGGVLEVYLTGIRCVWKVVVEAFLGVLWRFDVCIGLFRCVRVALGCLEGDVGAFRGCWGHVGGVLWGVWVCWGILEYNHSCYVS